MNNIKTQLIMNEKTIIYIILLGLLLYLYYKRRDITIIVAFVVLLGSTFIFGGIREGAKSGKGSGGGGVDKECAKLGFTAPKIDKKDITGSLEKTMKNVKKVADKHWPFDDMMGNKPKNDTAKDTFKAVGESEIFKSETESLRKDKKKEDITVKFLMGCAGLYGAFVGENAGEEKQSKIMKELTPKYIGDGIKGGEIYLGILNKNHKTLEGNDEKKLSNYLICLCKQWLQILKQYQKVKGSGGGDGDNGGDEGDEGEGEGEGDDEDSGKKKKKKSAKKKKSEDEDE